MINTPNSIAEQTLVLAILNDPYIKVVCSFIKTGTGVKIALRKSKRLAEINKSLYNDIRLDKLAELMDGGGHPGAAGARASSISSASKIILKWAAKYNFEIETINVGELVNSFS